MLLAGPASQYECCRTVKVLFDEVREVAMWKVARSGCLQVMWAGGGERKVPVVETASYCEP